MLKEDLNLELSTPISRVKEIIINSIFDSQPNDLISSVLERKFALPKDLIFAELSALVYQIDQREKFEKEFPGWKLLTVGKSTDIVTQYLGAAFWNGNERQIIISHRGTAHFKTFFTLINGVILNRHDKHIDSAVTFTDKIVGVLEDIKSQYGNGAPYIQLFITGHSLGGWLASLTSFTSMFLVNEPDGFTVNKNYNESGLHTTAITFDAPGCRDILQLLHDTYFGRCSNYVLGHLNITNYFSAPNWINCVNKHIGSCYRIFIDVSDIRIQEWDMAYLYYSFAVMHKIDRIKKVFHSNREPRIMKVIDWPLIQISENFIKLISDFMFAFSGGVFTIIIKSLRLACKVAAVKKELAEFMEFANSTNNYNVDESTAMDRKLRYKVKQLASSKCNEYDLSVFTHVERQFVQTYHMLTNNEAFDSYNMLSVLDIRPGMRQTLAVMLKKSKIEDNIIFSENCRELIPFVKHILHTCTQLKEAMFNIRTNLPEHILSEGYQLAATPYLKSIKNSIKLLFSSEMLREFLNDRRSRVYHGVHNTSHVGMVRVHSMLAEDKKYVFFTSTLIMDIGKDLFFAYVSKLTEFCLILEWPEMLFSSQTESLLTELFNIFKNKHNSKLILITGGEDNQSSLISKLLSDHNFVKYEECFNGVQYNELTPAYQLELISKKIIFQGNELPLKELLTGFNVFQITEILTDEVIFRLANDEIISVGNPLPSLGVTERYYVDRQLIQMAKVQEGILYDENSSDILCLSSVHQNIERLQFATKMSEIEQSSPPRLVILPENPQKHFDELCNQFFNHIIHWIELSETGNLIWRKTHGKGFALIHRYLKEIPYDGSAKLIDVTDMKLVNDEIVIVAAEPGMGKTTVFNRLGSYKSNPSDWFIRVNLIQYSNQFEQVDFTTEDEVDNFFIENENTSELTKKLLTVRLKEIGRIVIFFDGFDEMSCLGQRNFIQFLHILKEVKIGKTIDKILISTRLHLKNELEKNLCSIAFTLKPFLRQDQEVFLKRFWKKLPNHDTDQSRLDDFIKQLVEYMHEAICDIDRKFLEIPLQMKMVAEAFQLTLSEFLHSGDGVISFPNEFGLLQLYEEFIKAKYKIYLSKKGFEGFDIFSNDELALLTKGFNDILMDLAFVNTFADWRKHFPNNKSQQLGYHGIVNLTGIIQLIDGQPVFVHRTFQEYFAALFLYKKLKSTNIAKRLTCVRLLIREMFETSNEVVKRFLDYLLASEEKLHMAIVKHKEENIREIIANCPASVEVVDRLGRCAMHYAAQEGFRNTTILNVDNFDAADELGKTPLHYCTRHNSDKTIVKHFLNRSRKCMNSRDDNQRRPVYYAAQQGNWDVVQLLIDAGAIIDDLSGDVQLFHYINTGHIDGVKSLIEDNASLIHVTDKNKSTLLHIAAKKGQTEIAGYLLMKGIDLGAVNAIGKSSISCAAENGHWEFVEILLRCGANCNDLSGSQKVSLLKFHSAVQASWDIVKLLINNDSDDYINLLTDEQKLDFFMSLIETNCITPEDREIALLVISRGLAVNKQSSNSDRLPVTQAATFSHWDIVQELLRNGADFCKLSSSEKDPLFNYSIKERSWDIIRFYINGDSKDIYLAKIDESQRKDLLFHVVKEGDNMATKFLLKNNVDINCCDGNGRVPASIAIELYNWKLVSMLLKKGAVLANLTKEEIHKIFSEFILQGNYYIIQLIAHQDVNYLNKLCPLQRASLLHQSIETKDSELAQLVLEKDVNVCAPNNKGQTPLQHSASLSLWKIAEFLLKAKADSNELDSQQNIKCLRHLIQHSRWELLKLFDSKHFKGLFSRKQFVDYFCFLVHSGDNVPACAFIAMKNLVNEPTTAGKKALHLAIQHNRWTIVEWLLSENASVADLPDEHFQSALFYFTKLRNWKIVKVFINNDNDKIFNFCTSERLEFLCWMVENNDNEVRKLIDYFKDIFPDPSKEGFKAIQCAARRNNWDTVALFIENGSLVVYLNEEQRGLLFDDLIKKQKWSLISLCFNSGDNTSELILSRLEICQTNMHLFARYLMERECMHLSLSLLDRIKRKGGKKSLNIFLNNETLLHVASRLGKQTIVEYLVKLGADITLTSNKSASTAKDLAKKFHHSSTICYLQSVQNEQLLQYTADNCLEMVKKLVDQGAEIETTDNMNRTPLLVAASLAHCDIVRHLLCCHANVEAKNSDDRTILHFANNITVGLLKDILHNVGDLINATDKKGNTSLQLAIKHGDVEVVRLLLMNGALAGDNLLISAVRCCQEEIAKLLISYKASVHSVDTDGKTVLHIATQIRLDEIATLLVLNGANPNTPDFDGWSPLHYAAMDLNFRLVDCFLQNGGNIEDDGLCKKTPFIMMLAAQTPDWRRFNYEMSKFLEVCENLYDKPFERYEYEQISNRPIFEFSDFTLKQLYKAATNLFDKGKYRIAVHGFQWTCLLCLHSKHFGPNDTEYFNAQLNEARAISELDCYQEAIEIMEQILSDSRVKCTDESFIKCNEYMGDVFYKWGNYEQALFRYTTSLDSCSVKRKNKDTSTLEYWNIHHCIIEWKIARFGLIYVPEDMDRFRMRYVRSCDYLKENPKIKLSISYIWAKILFSHGLYDESLKLLQEIVNICAETVGNEHPNCLLYQRLLACTLIKLGDINLGINKLRQILLQQENLLGRMHSQPQKTKAILERNQQNIFKQTYSSIFNLFNPSG